MPNVPVLMRTWYRTKEIKKTEKKIRQIEKERDRETEEEDEERRQKGRILAGPKIERPIFLLQRLQCVSIPMNMYLSHSVNDHERMMSE